MSNKKRQEITRKLLENQRKFLEQCSEKTAKEQVGHFNNILFPMVRAAYPTSNLSDMVSVQPMSWPFNDMASEALRDAGITPV
jgi:hypothetical protein